MYERCFKYVMLRKTNDKNVPDPGISGCLSSLNQSKCFAVLKLLEIDPLSFLKVCSCSAGSSSN